MVFAIIVSKMTDYKDRYKQKRGAKRHLRMLSKGVEEVGDRLLVPGLRRERHPNIRESSEQRVIAHLTGVS